MLYAIIVMVFGKLLFGFILGSIASTLANLDTQRVLFEEKLFALKVLLSRLACRITNLVGWNWRTVTSNRNILMLLL